MIKINSIELGKYNGKDVKKYILKNSSGFTVEILNLGGIINKIITKDINGNFKNVVLSYDFFEKYVNNSAFPGSIIGPTSGRIENGEYLDSKLFLNNGGNNLHGGNDGLSNQVFDVEEIEYKEYKGIELRYFWPHLKDNFIGNVNYYIRYLINEKSDLLLELSAESDRDTYINLTNHSYFNLSGDLKNSAHDQILKIDANNYCPVKENMIPTGEKLDVKNTCFDFRNEIRIEDNFKKGNSQFDITRGYDHAFIKNNDGKLYLYSEISGISLEISTTQNVFVVYGGNFLEDSITFDGINKNYNNMGIAIEPQNYQNGINIENFDSKLTKRTKPYYEKIVYSFSVRK